MALSPGGGETMKPITIVGGGLAGLTLGIGLRQRGMRVSIVEAGRYPRHRVCGEFISGQGQAVLTRLGLGETLRQAGVRNASTARFFSASGRELQRTLPEPAWCLSRFVLDERLAREFRRLGGELREQERWKSPDCAKGIVRASGRRPQGLVGGWRLFALKAHARNVELGADLEIHLVPSGYVGLCRLADGLVNVCGLFRSRVTEPELSGNWQDWLRGPAGSALHARLSPARFLGETFCSAAGLSLGPQRALARTECCIGDSLTMIPPVTGNGMSMAFESAELALAPLAAYSQNEKEWMATQHLVARRCDAAFASRLRWAGWLQRALFYPGGQAVLWFVAANSGVFWRSLFARTR